MLQGWTLSVVNIEANNIDRECLCYQQIQSFLLQICLPQIPLKYTSNRKETIEEKLFQAYFDLAVTLTLCELGVGSRLERDHAHRDRNISLWDG